MSHFELVVGRSNFNRFVKMKIIILLLLITSALAAHIQNNCCSSNAKCCAGCNNQPNCCANCCKQTNCQTNTCKDQTNCQTSTCKDQTDCQTNTCKDQTDCQTDTSCKERCTQPPPTSSPPTSRPVTCGPSYNRTNSGSDSSCETHSAQLVNTDVKINNQINNRNDIYVPIDISNTNENTLDVDVAGGSTRIIEGYRGGHTNTVTGGAPYPILIPIPIPYPVPYPITQKEGCCTVVNPCVNQNCNQYQQTCGQQCTQRVMYNPVNPCLQQQGGCARRDYWMRGVCQPTGNFPSVNCGYVRQDCSACPQNFYQNYGTYQNCRGCFY